MFQHAVERDGGGWGGGGGNGSTSLFNKINICFSILAIKDLKQIATATPATAAGSRTKL